MLLKSPSKWDRDANWAPLVSVILPCYNAEEFISRTLDGLAAQTWPRLEILVGDDASTDGTLRIVEAFATGRGDTRVIARKHNLGWLGNTNGLMAQATGELMFFAFHDDVALPNHTEALVAALRRNPRAVLAYSDLEVTHPDGSHKTVFLDNRSAGRDPLARAYRMAARPRHWAVPIHGLFRSEAFPRIGGFKHHDEGEFSADWPWLLHMAILGEFQRVPEPLCHKFFQKTSISRNWQRNAREQMAMVRSGINEVRQSDLGTFSKAALIGYLTLRHTRMRVSNLIPRPVKNFIKRLVNRG